jgi:hypothetical protein
LLFVVVTLVMCLLILWVALRRRGTFLQQLQ